VNCAAAAVLLRLLLCRAADQKPAAALTLRHVDRIGELMEADDDDDMTSDGARRSLDKHNEHGRLPPRDAAASPPADARTSCERPDGAIGCHGDDDESDQLRRPTDVVEQSLHTQHDDEQQQQPGTGPPHH